MTSTPPPATHAPTAPPLEDHAVTLLKAVTEENLTFSHFAVLMAVHRREAKGETPSLAGISVECSYSYHAVRHIVLRTHYLEKIDSVPVALRLTPEGQQKIARVCKRIERYAAETPAATPQ